MSEMNKKCVNQNVQRFVRVTKKAAKEAAVKARKLADIAAVSVKLQGQSVKLSEKYEELGRLSYDKLIKNKDTADEMAVVIDQIDAIYAVIARLKEELAEKTGKKAPTDEVSADECDQTESIGLEIEAEVTEL